MAYLAGTIVNNVRDSIPDPVYSGGVPQPDFDGGLFRAQTLYRWLDDGSRLITARMGWTLTDWYAMPAVVNQPVYRVSPLFLLMDQAYAKQFKTRLVNQFDSDSIFPGRGTEPQSNLSYIYRLTDHVEVGFSPVPDFSDPVTTLSGGITDTDTSITVASVTDFLSYGFVFIEDELVQYQSISGTTLNQCTRGCGGTVAVAHLTGVDVTHCSFWVRGSRSPITITSSTSIVEVPLGWVSLLNTYLLAMCRESENEYQRSSQLLQQFDAACAGIARSFGGRDPILRRVGEDRRRDNNPRTAGAGVDFAEAPPTNIVQQ